MKRRTILRSMALGAIATPFSLALTATPATRAFAQGSEQAKIQAGIEEFAQLAPDTAVSLVVEDKAGRQLYAHQADKPLFIGSSMKTFVLAQFLREVEAGRLSEDAQFGVGPEVWSIASPVFQHLEGTTTGRSILEAMIQHSDNTATDVAMQAAGVDKIRQLIKEAGLTHTSIPDSTRKFFSYLAGADNGTDIGWNGILDLYKDIFPGKPRHAVNPEQSMLSTAHEMCHWYEQVLTGKFFAQADTLAEFKRISLNTRMVPADTLAYAKGGSIDWEGFHCFCLAGQMLQHERRTTFCFIINWEGPDEEVTQVFDRYYASGAKVLAQIGQ